MIQRKQASTLCLVILCLFGFSGGALAVTLEDGEYEVVVAIDPNMPHAGHETMVADIQDMMRDASSYLHTALRQQAIFARVTILVPDSWPDDPSYVAAEGESVAGADIFIATDIDCGACASPGRIEIDDGRMSGDTVVHEWGHYRFGLGDEYCDYVYKSGAWYQVYKTSAGWNRCTALQDIVRDCEERLMSGAGCTTTTNDVNGAKASIMHREWNAGIDSFCDDSTDDEYEHNDTVNNHQNRIWSRRSTWSVIESHADGFQYTGGTTIAYTDPVFEVKKVDDADIVLVVDVSGSMGSYSRIENASRAAENFVDRTAQGSYVGVVKFDDTASLEKSLTEITDNASRTSVKNKVPDSDSGGTTSIGAGMQTAATELNGSTTGNNKVMVLLTDGEENEAPWIADVLPGIVSAGIKVYSVGLGAASDSQLQDVAEQTGGTYFFAQDGDVGVLNEAFTEVANRTASIPGNIVLSESRTIPYGTSTFPALIDDTVGRFTVLTVSAAASDMPDLDVELERPDGVVYDDTFSGYTRDNASGVVLFRIDGVAQTGTWTTRIMNHSMSAADVTVEMTSARAPSKNAVALRAWLEPGDFPLDPIKVQAFLSSSESIIGADVRAAVLDPSGTVLPLPLNDNGQGGDSFARDGIYSAYFTEFTGNGRYSVKVLADNAGGGAQLGSQFKDGPGIQSDASRTGMIEREMTDPTARLNFQFEREALAGAFEVTGFVAGDHIPPARITTLAAIDFSENPPWLRVSWLATGDDMDNGQAASHDLRIATELIENDADFAAATPVAGLVAPKPSGEAEQITLSTLACSTDYFFAIKATDEAGNTSEISNVPSGMIVDTLPPTGGITAPADDSCHGASVTVEDDFTDICDADLDRTYSPGPGPTYDAHGDYDVTLTVEDDGGNTAQDTVSFSIDTMAPEVDILRPASEAYLPRVVPFTVIFSALDDDGATGDPVHEVIEFAGCTLYDGTYYGDGDGLLSDETLEVTVAELCRLWRDCGFESLDQPELRVEATDCGGNVGVDVIRFTGSMTLRPSVCNGPLKRND